MLSKATLKALKRIRPSRVVSLRPRRLLLYRTPFTLFLHRAEQPSWLGGSLSLNSLFSFLGPSCLLTRVEGSANSHEDS